MRCRVTLQPTSFGPSFLCSMAEAFASAVSASAGKPETGWVFPSTSREGHFNKDTAKDQHAKAIQKVNEKAEKNGTRKLVPFQPYVLRHTALTQLAQAGCDAFTLARIAGHSSITITQRYIHPQADAIERAFAPLATKDVRRMEWGKLEEVGTKLGTTPQSEKAIPRNSLVRKGGLEPPRFYPPDPKSGASANSATFARACSDPAALIVAKMPAAGKKADASAAARPRTGFRRLVR